MTRPLFGIVLAVWCLVVPCTAQEAPPPDAAERQALAELKRVEAHVHRTTKPNGAPSNSVTLYRLRADEDLNLVARLPFLERLSVWEGNLTDAGVERISRLPGLTSLSLEHVPLTDRAMVHVGSMTQLRDLVIRDVPVTDAGLAHLGRLRDIRDITVSDTRVTAAGVAELREALPYAVVSRTESRGEPWGLYAVAAVLVGLAAGAIWCGLKGRTSGRSRLWTVASVVGLVALPAVGLLALKKEMRPIGDGDAGTFWFVTTGLDVGAEHHFWGSFHRPRDGWFLYYAVGFHGQPVFRVDPAAVEALFPKIVERLRNAPPGRLRSDVEVGFREWDQTGADGVAGLLKKIEDARTARIRRDNPKRNYSPDDREREFDEQWTRANRYSWNLWFEFLFLAGLIVFAAWPWLRSAGRVRWAIHLGLTPMLLCLPYWLGYAPLTFTSAETSGGVLYPWLLRPFAGLPWSEIDTSLLRALPKPLEPLSQVPGPMLSLSGFGSVGPTAMLVIGAGVAVVVLWGPKAVRRLIRQFDKVGTKSGASAS